jgi:signal transduction histidine kinase
MTPIVTTAPFRPRARLLALLGDQLIRDSGIAIFELVKNGYDADAEKVQVTLNDIEDTENGKIIIRDDGHGMDESVVKNVWLEPGTDFRREETKGRHRTPKFGRAVLGEKGVGRFASHKLGRRICLTTRRPGGQEISLHINWEEFEAARYLEDTPVKIEVRDPALFLGTAHGTEIEISGLWKPMTRAEVRELHRSITSICSPFAEPAGFNVDLKMSPEKGWLEGLLDFRKVMDLAPYRAHAEVGDIAVSYDYDFVPPGAMDRVKGRQVQNKHHNLRAMDLFKNETRERIGPFSIDIRIFDLDREVLQFLSVETRSLRDYMRNNGGIRVYRDGVRVFDYGEPGNDWLELGTRRVNIPTKRVSNNLLIGAVHLSRSASVGLVEKTNREGFIEDETYELFTTMVMESLVQVEVERNIDKIRVRKAYDPRNLHEPVVEALDALRDELKRRGLEKDLGDYLIRIERQYRDTRELLISAAGSGLSLSVVVHEVEKGLSSISSAIKRGATISDIKDIADHLEELVDGLTYLMRKSGRKEERASILIRQAINNISYRLRAHNVQIIDDTASGGPDASIKCTRRLVIATLMNLIDNSIYWLENKGATRKEIWMGFDPDFEGGPALIVADNGPGFSDPPEMLVEPFMSRKPDGMGLGLHIADQTMKSHQGSLVFPERNQTHVPKGYEGAIIAMQFPSAKQ